MSESKHTKGPWSVEEYRGSRLRIVVAGPDVEICKRQERPGYPQDETRANARLISAAPDMLEALKGFNLKEEWIVGGQADSLTLRVPLSVIQAAAAAVAKATGE